MAEDILTFTKIYIKMLTCATRALTSPTADNSSKFNFVRSGGCTW